jgi:hypothetical protein
MSDLPTPVQNTVEDLHNLMLARGSDEFSSVGQQSTIGRAALSNANWQSILNGSNDDAGVSHQKFPFATNADHIHQWIVLALWKIGDYKSARGQDASPYNVRFLIYNARHC